MHARLENDSCVTRWWGGREGRGARAPLKYTGFACLLADLREFTRKREGEREKKRERKKNRTKRGARKKLLSRI